MRILAEQIVNLFRYRHRQSFVYDETKLQLIPFPLRVLQLN